MEPRHVELPEVAKRCWPKAIELINALMRECATLEHEAWYLGGGTALAADWQHRTSTDIDILIAPGLSMAALGPDANARIDQLIENQGGKRLTAPDQKLSVAYEPDGKVDIFSSGRQLPGHEEQIEVEGTPTQRLSNAQIFAGKLRRAIEGHAPARDLFDVCYGAKVEDRGFEHALNTLTDEEQRRIGGLWESTGAKIADEARRKLAGVKDQDLIPAQELGERASRTLKEHRYAHTIIRAGAGRAVVRTLTMNGQWREYESTAKTLEGDFEARGLTRYMMRQNIRPQAVLKDIGTHLDGHEMIEVRQIRTTEAGETQTLATEQVTDGDMTKRPGRRMNPGEGAPQRPTSKPATSNRAPMQSRTRTTR